ncbi:hypothetical protein PHLGIDRAFT_402279 [Phlebiopsis gigantea 11061_1 CR5-6]|uniref:Transmembrane protein n=1 Tax=Phlebiopsis gigantea (strain 11061_1 CR5-6) TaxID=745531 RepID=A0A0C3PMT9_PHLG1|nr:hypothetical protein PHLGIDRAFT_402279 [Phlebiopsis gigantea 11061_1 CR5-6]
MHKRLHVRIDRVHASFPTPHEQCSTTPYRLTASKMSDARVNPVGIVFAAILITAFTIGVSATTYYAWIQPALARYRLRKRLRDQQSTTGRGNVSSPDKNNYRLNTPNFGSPAKDLEKGGGIFIKETVVIDDVLPPPKPTFAFAKTDRFSTSTRDGVWWFV